MGVISHYLVRVNCLPWFYEVIHWKRNKHHLSNQNAPHSLTLGLNLSIDYCPVISPYPCQRAVHFLVGSFPQSCYIWMRGGPAELYFSLPSFLPRLQQKIWGEEGVAGKLIYFWSHWFNLLGEGRLVIVLIRTFLLVVCTRHYGVVLGCLSSP